MDSETISALSDLDTCASLKETLQVMNELKCEIPNQGDLKYFIAAQLMQQTCHLKTIAEKP